MCLTDDLLKWLTHLWFLNIAVILEDFITSQNFKEIKTAIPTWWKTNSEVTLDLALT